MSATAENYSLGWTPQDLDTFPASNLMLLETGGVECVGNRTEDEEDAVVLDLQLAGVRRKREINEIVESSLQTVVLGAPTTTTIQSLCFSIAFLSWMHYNLSRSQIRRATKAQKNRKFTIPISTRWPSRVGGEGCLRLISIGRPKQLRLATLYQSTTRSASTLQGKQQN